MHATDDVTSEAADAGNRLEDVILDWCGEQIGHEIKRNVHCVHSNGIFAANLDGVVVPDELEIVEAKSTGVTDEWGEPGTNEVPFRVFVQAHFQMFVHGAKLAHVPVLLGRFGLRFRHYVVPREEKVCDAVAEECDRFWRRHILTKMPPSQSKAPHLDVVKRIRREPDKVVHVDDDLVRRWQEAKEQEKAAKQSLEEAQAVLLAALGDAEAADCGLGRVTYFGSPRRGYTVEAKDCVRTLRLKEAAKDIA